MPTIEPILPETASDMSRQLLDKTERGIGHSSNMLRTMAHSPVVLDAYIHFNSAFQQSKISTRLRGLLTMAIAQRLGSEYILSVALALGKT